MGSSRVSVDHGSDAAEEGERVTMIAVMKL
jgi:hypothetical protein